MMSKSERLARLMPNGEPRWIRCYDNGGETADRYTVLFVGKRGGDGLSMSRDPFCPLGIGLHFEFKSYDPPDRVGNSWGGVPMGRRCRLGVRIPFSALPDDCRRAVVDDYRVIWGL